MKVEVKKVGRRYEVWLVQDVQSFRLDYFPTHKAEAQWYAKMLRIALKKHKEDSK